MLVSSAHGRRWADRRGEPIGSDYVLGDVLGRGGMGVVYSAVQRSLGRPVAIKLPRPELAADPGVRRQFRMEALASARIEHRSIVHVVDYGEIDGSPYLVLERLAAPRLGDLVCEHGPMPVPAAIQIVAQVLDALAALHAAGVVHCDVKSDNVLVERLRDGGHLPRLIDFGLAGS